MYLIFQQKTQCITAREQEVEFKNNQPFMRKQAPCIQYLDEGFSETSWEHFGIS